MNESYNSDEKRPPKVGETYDQENYILVLTDFFKNQSYCPHCKNKIDGVVPGSYYITSGEAVAKAEKLLADAWALAGEAQKLLNALKRSRGEAPFLESTQEGGQISAKRKYKRDRPVYINKYPKRNIK